MKSLNVTYEENHAIVQIDHGKVNAIDTILCLELAETFNTLAKEEKIKGIILTGRPHCFSAGLDIMKQATGGEKGVRDFWHAYLLMCRALIRYPKPFVCAITGFAPAGATIIACCADYKIMGRGSKHRIGMHEFKMSLQIPELLCYIYAYALGEKNAWEAVMDAKLYSADEAAAVGLVNEACEVEEVMNKAKAKLTKLTAVYTPVYAKTKKYLRRDLLKLVDFSDVELKRMKQDMVDVMKDPKFVAFVQQFMMSLKKK